MVLELANIKVNSSNETYINLFQLLDVDLEPIVVKVVNTAAKGALRAYQSKVPINTGELRNEKIQANFARVGSLEASVYVVDSIHVNSRGTPIAASKVASELDEGTSPKGLSFLRSRNSQAYAPFSSIPKGDPTSNWILSADLEIAKFLVDADIDFD